MARGIADARARCRRLDQDGQWEETDVSILRANLAALTAERDALRGLVAEMVQAIRTGHAARKKSLLCATPCVWCDLPERPDVRACIDAKEGK
jgi:hypothetical protein